MIVVWLNKFLIFLHSKVSFFASKGSYIHIYVMKNDMSTLAHDSAHAALALTRFSVWVEKTCGTQVVR